MPNNKKIGIYDETDRLKTAVLWGPVGVEAVLTQLYPSNISLFSGPMNVKIARKEALAFAKTLKNKGVKVILARDAIAHSINPSKKQLSKENLIKDILKKINNIKSKYHTRKSSKEFLFPDSNYEKIVRDLVELDIDRYGEQRSLNLNKKICLETKLPLGNAIFARDQMNVLLGTRFDSSMSKLIRKPEVKLYEQVYQKILKFPPAAKLKDTTTFEGGDAYIHNRTVYVGVGIRTSQESAKYIFSILRKQLEEKGFKFAIVEDRSPKSRSEKEQMDFMHLDMFSGPIGKKEMVVYEEEAKKRQVSYIRSNEKGKIEIINTGDSFLEHLQKTDDLVIKIPLREQQRFGCNFLALDGRTILLPLDSNSVLNQRLRRAGKKLIFLDLKESTRGYGAAHCMTGQLLRG
jgi:arginine deiminase